MRRPAIGVIWLAVVVSGGVAIGMAGSRPEDAPGTPGPGSAAKGKRGPVRYDRDIRPILSDRCFKCHGPDAAARQAGLRLDVRESAVARLPDGAAIVPGQSAQSEMWRRISSDSQIDQMPPPGSNKRVLSPEELELVKRWIDEGAAYEPHWSFVAPVAPALPELSSEESAWSRNPIDWFIIRELHAHGVEPSPEADAATLVRRVFIELTGLPPTPEEIDAYLADSSPDAYEKLVDRLMGEEPYLSRHAERMAAPWLDAARYADTNGTHTDAGRQIWPWRDWVLNAYRDNVPFDRFLTEQLAGDLLPGATQDQKVATGFNRNHVQTDEGGAIPEEYIVEYAVDRAATTGSVFLGLTFGCARCHDHKFDPVSQEEFYGLYAFFNSIEEPGLYSQLPDSNRAFEPFMSVPNAEQRAALEKFAEELKAARGELESPAPEEESQRAAYLAALPGRLGVSWASATVTGATSTGGSTMSVQGDGSVLASGANPDRDEHVVTLRTEGTGLRLLSLEAIADESLPHGRVGRSENGNAVLSEVEVEAVSVADPTNWGAVRFEWAWADIEQEPDANSEEFAIISLIDGMEGNGWAVDGHRQKGNRTAILLAQEPFGFEGGTELVVRLKYRSMYARHSLGRVRLGVGRIGETGLEELPAAASGWYVVGPFPVGKPKEAFERAFGPESEAGIDPKKNFGEGNQVWKVSHQLRDDALNGLADGTNVTYVGRRVFCATAREVEVSVGSDDGFRIYVNGKEGAARNVERGLMANQDKAKLRFERGLNTVVFKVVNTGGASGFYWRASPRGEELPHDMVAAMLPAGAVSPGLADRVGQAWRIAKSPGYRQRQERVLALEKSIAELEAVIPRTMVMQELAKPRETFLLTRGAYDHPDKNRPIARGVPAALGRLPEGAPLDRAGLAAWLVAPENPLTARVAVNRMWEMLFGAGLVKTSEDFGQQGEWPSHPELLDWLATEFRVSGWDVRRMMRLMVTSATYRQASRVRAEVAQRDPENRWLAWYPRRRLTAEQTRDLALAVSGLLVEKFGGPSVKPYQPEGLWQEVAMPASNTRVYVPGMGTDFWRRSLYTYWKRACPPPSLMAFDAPTREFCTIRRATTNTPLQALVLLNDEQFLEAARVLAQRTIAEGGGDEARIGRMFRRCCGRLPEEKEVELLRGALGDFRSRYAGSPEDARALVRVGRSPAGEGDAAELAAWTMIGSAILNSSEAITQD